MNKTVLIILCLFVTIPAYALPGSGTQQDPWVIQSLADFQEFASDANYLDDHTRLETDVNLAGITYLTSVIAPDKDNVFTGVFDGNDHKITGLTIDTIDDGATYRRYLGLFGYIDGGQLRNLHLEEVSVNGDYLHVGGLVGYNRGGGIISNCSSTGSVSGYGSVGGLVGHNGGRISNCYSNGPISGTRTIGGLVGYNGGGIISNCYSTGTVDGDERVGGLLGGNSGSVSNCYSTGSVNGDDDVGGLVGNNQGNVMNCYSTGPVSGDDKVGGLVGYDYSGTVLNCYSTGSVNGDFYVGGLVGSKSGSFSNCYSTGSVSGYRYVGGLVGYNRYGNVSNCYSTGSVSGDYYVGGLVGFNYDGTVLNCFWDIQTSGISTSDGGTGKTTAEMMDINTYLIAGWDFLDESANGTAETWMMPAAGGYPVLSRFHIDPPTPLSGCGTVDEPYLIGTAGELGMVSWYPEDCFFELVGDIDLSGINWSVPVAALFNGQFDGNSHAIKNLQISGGKGLGLFGNLGRDGQVINLGLEDCSISGTASYVGGLVGRNYGTVSNCYSTGSVSGDYYVGGLVGYNKGIISNCYSTGTIGGDEYVGGLVGYIDYQGGRVSTCYSTGSVSGYRYVGGLAGVNHGSFSNCYSTGSVSGDDYVGGLVGNTRYSSVMNCFWDIQTSGINTSGGGTGKTTEEMMDIDTYLNAGWDFLDESANGTAETWMMPASGSYPVLSFFHIAPPTPLSGSGTIDEPYLIGTAGELGMVSWYPEGRFFELVGDIDLSGVNWSVPVVPVFSGRFDGNSHVITNLQISGGRVLGLFGNLSRDGQVINLGLEDCSVSGTGDYVGALVGKNYGTISDCYSTGSVNGHFYSGGLMGENYGSVSKCYSTSSVSGIAFIGGALWEKISALSLAAIPLALWTVMNMSAAWWEEIPALSRTAIRTALSVATVMSAAW